MTILWLNGNLLDTENARIDPADRGFLLGVGLFETLLVHTGKPVFATDHLARLRQGAARLNIPLVQDDTSLTQAMNAVLSSNALTTSERASLRITLTEGPGPRGLASPARQEPTLLISAAPGQTPAPTVTAITTTIRRNEMSDVSELKTLAYLDQVRARQEAAEAGVDAALFLNTKGKLCCATAANIFLWDSNTLLTPPLSDGCLNGITRQKVISLARAQGMAVFEESITPSTLAGTDSAFITNSLIGLQELDGLDGRPMQPHRHTAQLRTALAQAEQQSLT